MLELLLVAVSPECLYYLMWRLTRRIFSLAILGFILLCVGICVRRRRVTRRVVYVDPAPAAVTTVTTTPYIPPSQPLYNQPTGGFDPYAPAYPPPIAQPGFAPQVSR